MNLDEVKAKCTGVSIATINLGNEYSLTKEVQWLIKQVEKLQEENKSLTERFHKQADYIINLVEKIERLQR